jgi:hypothetical protein
LIPELERSIRGLENCGLENFGRALMRTKPYLVSYLASYRAMILTVALATIPAFAGNHFAAHPRTSQPSNHLGPHAYLESQYMHHAYNTQRCQSCARDSHGRILRNPQANREFRNTHPCPAAGKTVGACPGYVADHIRALKHGGADVPSNMQWQTITAAREKDKSE